MAIIQTSTSSMSSRIEDFTSNIAGRTTTTGLSFIGSISNYWVRATMRAFIATPLWDLDARITTVSGAAVKISNISNRASVTAEWVFDFTPAIASADTNPDNYYFIVSRELLDEMINQKNRTTRAIEKSVTTGILIYINLGLLIAGGTDYILILSRKKITMPSGVGAGDTPAAGLRIP